MNDDPNELLREITAGMTPKERESFLNLDQAGLRRYIAESRAKLQAKANRLRRVEAEEAFENLEGGAI
jgi:hypothetical protein